jgi:hypothetical protein
VLSRKEYEPWHLLMLSASFCYHSFTFSSSPNRATALHFYSRTAISLSIAADINIPEFSKIQNPRIKTMATKM